MRNLICICIGTFIISNTFSQYKDGYLITKTNDTIYGQIYFDGSFVNSRICKFKKDSSDSEHAYTPNDISAFRFTNSKYFISKTLKIDNTYEKVFLEWLIKGKANILSYSPTISDIKYYLSNDKDSLVELKNSTDTLVKGDKTFFHERKEYVGILKYYLSDANMQSQISNSRLETNSLIKIAKEYHYKTCKDYDCIIFEDKNRKLKFNVGLEASYYYSKLFLNNQVEELVPPVKVIGFGIFVNINNLPVLSPNFSFNVNFNYYHLSYKYKPDAPTVLGIWNGVQPVTFTVEPDKNNTFIEFTQFSIPLKMNYNFLKNKKVQPFISVGYTINLRTNIKQSNKYLYYFVNNKNLELSGDFFSYQDGFSCGLGLSYLPNSKTGFSLYYDFEYSNYFFGTKNSYNSVTYNYIVHLAFYRRF